MPSVDAEIKNTTSGVLRIRNLDMMYSLSYSSYDSYPWPMGKLVVKLRGPKRIVILVVLLVICASNI